MPIIQTSAGSKPGGQRNWAFLYKRDRGFFVLEKGTDYTCSEYSIVSQIRNQGSKFRKSVSVEVRGDRILVEYRPREEGGYFKRGRRRKGEPQ